MGVIMESAIKKWLTQNIIWLMGLLVILGGLLYTIKDLEKRCDAEEIKIVTLFQKTSELHTVDAVNITKLDNIGNDIKEIKNDLREVKTILVNRKVAVANEVPDEPILRISAVKTVVR